MQGKLVQLAEKVDQVLTLMERLKQKNGALREENDRLKTQLQSIQKECRELKLGYNDRAELVKAKLTAVLGRLDELEGMYR